MEPEKKNPDSISFVFKPSSIVSAMATFFWQKEISSRLPRAVEQKNWGN